MINRVLDVDLDKSGWEDIQKEVGQIQRMFNDNDIKEILRKIGTAIKKHVKEYAPKSEESRKMGEKHIKDDITFKIKKNRNGELYVSVRGGRDTGYKWNWVNGGHIAQNGKFIPGSHFVDKAQISAESDINSILDNYLKKVVE